MAINPYRETACRMCQVEYGDNRIKRTVGGLCYTGEPWHYQKQQQAKYLENQKGKVKKQYELQSVSKKRQEQLKLYRIERDQYFREHPVCEFPGCNSREVTLHHAAGRLGKFLTDNRYFKSLCMPHHRFVEDHPEEALRLGLSYKRVEK